MKQTPVHYNYLLGKKKKQTTKKLVSSCKSQHTDSKNINPIYPGEDVLPILLALFAH